MSAPSVAWGAVAAASLSLHLVAFGAGAEIGSEVRELELPVPRSGPSIVAVAADGSVWASLARAGALLRVDPQGGQHVHPLPEGSFPVGLAIDASGGVWYSDIKKNRIVHLDPENGRLRPYDVPTPDSWPFFLVTAADGSLWFTERMGNKIGRLDPATGRFTEYPVATPHAQPAGLARTPDGQLFFTQNSANRVGHLDPVSGVIRDLPIPSPASPGPYYGPAGIASDAAGNVWFAQLDGRLGLIRHDARDHIEEIPLPHPKVRPGGVVVDRWGIVWFTGLDGNMIGSFHPEYGHFRSYPIPSGEADPRPMSPPEVSARGELPQAGATARSTRPFGIAFDDEGRIWFSEQYGHRLGYVIPSRLDIASPEGLHRGPAAPVRTVWRDHAEVELTYRLDGDEIEVDGSLDLSELDPGRHVWEVVARDRGGATLTAARTTFQFVPTLASASRAVGRDRPDGPLRSALDEALRKVEAGRADAAREVLRAALAVAPDRLADQLRYLLLFGELEVMVSASTGSCEPAEVTVQPGDSVTWHNADGRALRIAAEDGSFAAKELAPRGRWTRTFHREATIPVRCGDGGAGVVHVVPRQAPLHEIPLPEQGLIPTVLVLDDEGTLWFAAGGGGYASLAEVPLNNKIGRLDLDGSLRLYATPTPESAPTSIKVAPDGTVWFTERAGNAIGRLDPASGEIVEYPVPTADSAPTGIAVADDGSVWFTEKAAGKIGRLEPANGRFTELATPHQRSEPSTVVVDEAGNVWFDERGADNLVRLNPATGEMTQYPVPTVGSRVIGLVPDPRGYMWFLELAGQKVGRLEIETGQIVEYAIPTRFAAPFKAALDGFGRLWFTQAYGNRLGVLDGERFFEYALPRAESMPGGIEITADGTIWMTMQAGNALARLDRAAQVPPLYRELEEP